MAHRISMLAELPAPRRERRRASFRAVVPRARRAGLTRPVVPQRPRNAANL